MATIISTQQHTQNVNPKARDGGDMNRELRLNISPCHCDVHTENKSRKIFLITAPGHSSHVLKPSTNAWGTKTLPSPGHLKELHKI